MYSTYLGGSSGAGAAAIAIDASGNVYVTGSAGSGFPTTSGAFQDPSYQGPFVTKLNTAGSALVYSTASMGGSAIALDSTGNAYLTGRATSPDFPVTAGAFQTALNGPDDAFVSKLNATGSSLVYSTYLGGSGIIPYGTSTAEGGSAIAADALGNAYVVGQTRSSDFPITPGAYQTTNPATYKYGYYYGYDAFVSKFSFADAPGIVLTPASLTFATQAVGTTSAPQTVALLDAGSQPLSIISIKASGDFAESNTCGGAVSTGTSCTISVTITPTTTGTRTGAVTITDNAAGSPHQLSLTGTGGGEPAVTFSRASLTFAAQILGTESTPQPVTLKNTGSAELDMSISTTGDFVQTNDCTGALQPTQSCTFSVVFTPTAQGTRSGAITISDDAPGSPHKVRLTGAGVAQAGQGFTFNTLVQGLDGNLYGTAFQGGTSSQGTVFKATPAGTSTTLYNFDSTRPCLGTTQNCGAVPYAGLVLGTDGNFYGTTYEGGDNGGYGTVFQITPGGVLSILYSFFGGGDGGYPEAALVRATDGKFYGTTSQGGAYGLGTIFTQVVGNFSTWHTFQYLFEPLAALLNGSDGNFYGTTAYGGKGHGVVFEISPQATLNVVHQFGNTDGAQPEGALVEGSDGKLYGTTVAGGANGNGTVFRLGRFGGGFTTLHSFAGADGSRPGSGLILATDGNFYGTTWGGGTSGCGTLFRITGAGTLTTLYNFNCTTDGRLPYGRPVQHTSGTLCATNGGGRVFSLNVGLGPFVKLLPTSAAPGTNVTILATNLTGTTSVSFNGTSAAFTVVSSSEITTTVPASATTGKVRVVTPSGTLVSDVSFGVGPVISGFSPTSGPVGTSVVITGWSFTGATRVTFGGVRAQAARFAVDSSTQITATVPSGAKTGRISVATPAGTGSSAGQFWVTP